jgi:hypothetical protein
MGCCAGGPHPQRVMKKSTRMLLPEEEVSRLMHKPAPKKKVQMGVQVQVGDGGSSGPGGESSRAGGS